MNPEDLTEDVRERIQKSVERVALVAAMKSSTDAEYQANLVREFVNYLINVRKKA
jgi:2-iminoacetate synthase ThiH